jgi:hypothetical protein
MAGSPILWILFFTAVLTAVFGAVMFLSGEAWGAAVTVFCALAAAWSALIQVRFSPRQSSRVFGITFLLAGCVTASAGPLYVGGAIAVAGALLSVFGFMRTDNPLPGVLDVVPLKQFYESDGVHFVVGWSEQPVARGGSFGVLVVAQNIMTAPRELIVRLDGVGEHAVNERERALPLSPGAIVRASFPFRLTALAEGTLRFTVCVEGRGNQPGLRLRRDRGAEYVADLAGANLLAALTLVTLGAGTFRFGGSKTVALPVDEQAPEAFERAQRL